MKVAYVKNPASLATLTTGERPDPVPAAGEVLVRVRASSLNSGIAALPVSVAVIIGALIIAVAVRR